MTILQPLLYIGIPAILILAGMFFNWSAANRFDTKLEALNGRFDVLKDYVNVRFDEVKDSGHKDALIILKELTELHERVAIVESKQK